MFFYKFLKKGFFYRKTSFFCPPTCFTGIASNREIIGCCLENVDKHGNRSVGLIITERGARVQGPEHAPISFFVTILAQDSRLNCLVRHV